MMKRYILLSFVALISVGCGSMGLSPKSERYQMEMTLHKTRADLEELKHDLHTQKMELSILEGKVLNQEDNVASLKKETFDIHQVKLDSYYAQIANLERKWASFEKRLDETTLQVGKLIQTASETHKALAQNKERLNEMEKTISAIHKVTHDVAKLKKNVDKVSDKLSMERPFLIDTYRVKSGDTLDSIASKHATSVVTIQMINRLETDKIFMGQELLVPKVTEL